MSQPQGYISAQHPDYVCRLHKSIYGLKQAPRAWFERFIGQLLQFGFTASAADSSLFIYRSKTIIAYLLLYVDDIVLTSNTPNFLDTLIQHLSSIFELKDLGTLLSWNLGHSRFQGFTFISSQICYCPSPKTQHDHYQTCFYPLHPKY